MQVVAKTPHINIRMEGDIPPGLLEAVRAEVGDQIRIHDGDDEYEDAMESDWYRGVKLVPGMAVKHYREMHGMTQARLGELLGGIPRQNISNMENGRRAISLEMAKQLAIIFHAAPVNFLDI